MNYFNYMKPYWGSAPINWKITNGDREGTIINVTETISKISRVGEEFVIDAWGKKYTIVPHHVRERYTYVYADQNINYIGSVFYNVVREKKPTYRLDHVEQTITEWEFNNELILLGQRLHTLIWGFPSKHHIYPLALWMVTQPFGQTYVINPLYGVSMDYGDIQMKGIDFFSVGEIDPEDAILLKLHNPSVIIYHHEAL